MFNTNGSKHESQATATDWDARNKFLKSIGLHESQDRGDRSVSRIVTRNEVLKKVGLHIYGD